MATEQRESTGYRWRIDPRVCEVAALPSVDAGEGMLGSGFLIDTDRVITARHVIAPTGFEAVAWRVRPVGERDWLDAEPVWSSPTVDVAVLEVTDSQTPHVDRGVGTVRFGRLAGADPVTARAVGFPDARRVRTSSRGLPVRDPEDVRGELRPPTAAKGGLLSLHLWGATPEWAEEGTSPWAGMSGAAVFHGPWLVGVVSIDPANFAGDRLEIATVETAAEDSGWPPQLSFSPVRLEVADRPGALVEPYRAPRTRSVRLLDARYGLVPFAGREAELESLVEWCHQPADASVRLITGPGGQGKTRLAAQLAEIMATDGWLTGFIEPEISDGDLEHLLGLQGPKLLIIDYADGRTDQVLSLAAKAHEAVDRLRLLLLVRHAGRWWDSLPYQASRSELFDDAEVLPLTPFALALADRETIFGEAARAIANYLGKTSEVDIPDLSDDTFGVLLFVHLAALTHVDPQDTTSGPRATLAHRLLDEVLLREDLRYWKPSAPDVPALAGDSPTTRQRCVAVATLTAASDESSAVSLLTVVPGIDVSSATATAHWLHDLNPEPPYLSPLEPDRLGEHLVSGMLAERPTFVDELLSGDGQEHINRILIVLTRAAEYYETGRAALRRVLSGNIQGLVNDIAERSDLTAGQILATAFDGADDPGLAQGILDVIPKRSLALGDLAVAANQAVLMSVTNPEDRAPRLNALSSRLAVLGRPEEALTASEEAVAYYRVLAEERPNLFLRELAGSLNNLHNRLAELGRPEEALTAIEEAVAKFRVLAEDRPDLFLSQLAGSLNNLSSSLVRLGRPEEALTAIEEAVEIRWVLAEDRPDAFFPELAGSLNHLSDELAELGRPQEALTSIEEAANRILPLLERSSYVFPYPTEQLYRTYLERCKDTASDPDQNIVQRFIALLTASGLINHQDD